MRKLVGILALILGMAGAAYAVTGGGGVTSAPEIDPAGAMAGLTLLAGGLAVLRGRRRK
jgi:LPXTG-motif cell wall-anchored protein